MITAVARLQFKLKFIGAIGDLAKSMLTLRESALKNGFN
jgi:hypothetical protein